MLEGPKPTIIITLLLILLRISLISSHNDECLRECICKWKYGKQTVECISINLKTIPDEISSQTQVLNLSGNPLHLLPSRVFQRTGLINLQRLYVPSCELSTIADDAFQQLVNLVELDLNTNSITFIPTAALKDTPLLRRLILNFNPIQKVENDSFLVLPHLITLELRSCRIETIEPRAFEGLKNLEYLKLDGNKLRTSPPEMVKPFSNLHALELHQNPWECDCHLRNIRKWFLRHDISMSASPQCSEPPRLRALTWDELNVDEFACEPKVTVTESSVTFIEGENATLSVQVVADPEAFVSWIWKGRVIHNLTVVSFGRQMYLIKEVVTRQHKFHSFTILNVMLKDSGQYLCVVSNPAGRISTNITLNVLEKGAFSNTLKAEEVAGFVMGAILDSFIAFCSYLFK